MRNSKLKEEYMKEESFWHITNKKNIESIREKGMVPKDGKREGVLKSEIDPVPRVFFSHGLEAVLWQANNLAYFIDNFCTEQIKVKEDGYNRKELNKEIKKFLEDKEDGKENTKGFIDIGLFLQEKINSKGISKSITEKDLEMVSYNLTKSLWENSIYIKANLEDGIDYSYEKDFNYIRGGKTKPMDKANMHTFEGRSIDSEKLEVMSDNTGKPLNSWEVLKQMAEYYKKENPDKYDGKTLTEDELNEIGFTTDKSKIVNGENVLTIPDEEGYRRYSYKSKYWKIWYIIIRTCNA